MAFWLVAASMTVHTVSLDGDIFIVNDDDGMRAGTKEKELLASSTDGDLLAAEEVETTGSSSTSSLHTLEDDAPQSTEDQQVWRQTPPLTKLPQVLELACSSSSSSVAPTKTPDPEAEAALQVLEQAAAASSGMVTPVDSFRLAMLAKRMQRQGPNRGLQHTDSFALAQQHQHQHSHQAAPASPTVAWTPTIMGGGGGMLPLSPSFSVSTKSRNAVTSTTPSTTTTTTPSTFAPPPPPLPLSSALSPTKAKTTTTTSTPPQPALSKVSSLPSLTRNSSSSGGNPLPLVLKKHVQFAPSVRVRVVPRYDEDEEQKAATWFSPRDFADIQREISICIEEERQRRKQEYRLQQQQRRRRRRRGSTGSLFSFCQPYANVEEEEDQNCGCISSPPPPCPARPCRGLERVSFDADGERRKAMLHNVLCMVLREQCQQKRRGFRNELALAEASRHFSHLAVEEALATARQDAWDVKDEDDEEEDDAAYVLAQEEHDEDENREDKEEFTTTQVTTTTMTATTTTKREGEEEEGDIFHPAASEAEATIVVWPSVWNRLLWRCGTQPLPKRHSLPGPRKSTSMPSLGAL